jgi:hypothetical protein
MPATTTDRRLRKCDCAEILGVSRARISQLVRDGHLHPEPDGKVLESELDRCRRCEPINWQIPCLKSGRRSAAVERERREQLAWFNVELALRDYWGLSSAQWREVSRRLYAAMQANGLPLPGQ